jgi:hypothetical protein
MIAIVGANTLSQSAVAQTGVVILTVSKIWRKQILKRSGLVEVRNFEAEAWEIIASTKTEVHVDVLLQVEQL